MVAGSGVLEPNNLMKLLNLDAMMVKIILKQPPKLK